MKAAVAERALVESELGGLAVVVCSADIETGIVLQTVELVLPIHFRHARPLYLAYGIFHGVVFVLRQRVACKLETSTVNHLDTCVWRRACAYSRSDLTWLQPEKAFDVLDLGVLFCQSMQCVDDAWHYSQVLNEVDIAVAEIGLVEIIGSAY